MQKLFDAGSGCAEEEVRTTVMQIFVEIGKQEYESVEYYFGNLATITAKAAREDDEKVGA
jgi:hypothetical protein